MKDENLRASVAAGVAVAVLVAGVVLSMLGYLHGRTSVMADRIEYLTERVERLEQQRNGE